MHAVPTRYLTVQEVWERRGCSRSTLYEELKVDPYIPRPFKVGRRTFFVEAEVEAWLRGKAELGRVEVPHNWNR